jgi:hypothetical protein
MKRDDFGVRIDEIRELATKYSKPDLARMVQMGMIEPQKALMAGMMIDRIAKSAAQPPQTTVVEDVLMPRQPEQQGIMGAPGAPPSSEGVAALPSGITEMAGGGIVAFDEGGYVPGYADRGVVDSRRDAGIIETIDPGWRSPKTRKRQYTADDRFATLAEQLAQLTAAEREAQGLDKVRLQKDMDMLRGEMRMIKPRVDPDSFLMSLIKPAAAATPAATPPAAAPAAAAPEYFYQDPFGAPSSTQGEISLQQQVERGKPYDPSIRGQMFGYKQVEPSPPKPAPAAPPSKFEVQPVETPAPERREAPPAVTEPKLEKPEKIVAQQLPVPKERGLKQTAQEIQDAYKEFGVDTDMYKNQMKELEGKKAGLAKRREQALGAALMSFGLELAGARQGQEFQSLSRAGVNALGQYMNNMDKIVENEDRIDMLNRQLQMAENNFKRTGADSALAQMRAHRERIDQIEVKNAEFKQRADEAQAKIGADIFGAELGAGVRKDIARQNVLARIAAALGSNKGGFSDKQIDELYDKVEMQNRKRLEDLYKDKYYGADLERKVSEELVNLAAERAKQASTIRQKGGIAAPSAGGNPWLFEELQSGVD